MTIPWNTAKQCIRGNQKNKKRKVETRKTSGVEGVYQRHEISDPTSGDRKRFPILPARDIISKSIVTRHTTAYSCFPSSRTLSRGPARPGKLTNREESERRTRGVNIARETNQYDEKKQVVWATWGGCCI